MRQGTPGFSGPRLREAREARGLTATALSDLVGVTRQVISLYELGETSPSFETLYRIAGQLNMPLDFFSQEARDEETATIFYRSLSSATKAARTRAERRLGWLKDIVAYLLDVVELPPVNIPVLDDLPSDPMAISSAQIEDAATRVRRFWKLGDGPISNVSWLLENHGAVVTRGVLDSEALDAFSGWLAGQDRPFVFLGADKASAARSRLDAAHELGHLILHRHVNKKQLATGAEFKTIEAQAFQFAGAFLLPASSFATELRAPTLSGMQMLKAKWVIAIGAMIQRAKELNMITQEHADHLWISRARRGWNRHEPLDDELPIEEPRVLRQCFDLLIEAGARTREQIITDLHLPAADIEALSGLPSGYLAEAPPMVRLLSQPGRRRSPQGSPDGHRVLDFPG